ncbi:PatA/PatG family cyanobactin maturation protease [Bauldia sp.]|uniref:PatA/PatG family cyanobactin maturation protease n=1 Tax=Bauldia sp. TaxID=2575872 RepID=UPI003BAA0F62
MANIANINRIKGLEALQADCGDASEITIAVLDGPVDVGHAAFEGAQMSIVAAGVRAADTAAPSRTHGTHVASILFGQPSGPVTGIAPTCRGVLVPIFSDTADGDIRPCSEVDLARALEAALEAGAQVINVSAGRLSHNGTASPHLQDAVRRCIDAGALVVAAAGNDGCDCLQVPAALPGVLVVGAMDEAGRPVGFSNWGAAYRNRGVLAPGTGIIGAAASGGTTPMSGTSFATPLVAGISALMMARQTKRGAPADGQAVMQAIVDGADRCDPSSADQCERFLAGALNLDGALQRLDAEASSYQPAESGRRPQHANEPIWSRAMDQNHTDAQQQGEGAAIQAMAEQLKSIEAAVAGLTRTLGGLQPAGLPEPVAQPAVATPTAVAEVLPPASEVRTAVGPSVSDAETLQPAACCDDCAAAAGPRQLVFALGKLGYDFGNEERLDSIQSQLENRISVGDRQPSALNPVDMVAFLRESPPHSPAITWTLNLNGTPIYAIKPHDYYLEETYGSLVDVLDAQTSSAVAAGDTSGSQGGRGSRKKPPPPIERMSVPGVITGQVELANGLVIPTVQPALGGMAAWSTQALVDALSPAEPKDSTRRDLDGAPFDPRRGLETFLNRIYEELRNLGREPRDRALNYAATNAFQANEIFVKMRDRNIHIEKFEVMRSPVMRPDSDCWDVKMTFFDPTNPTTRPREVYFYTIDVNDVVPVPIGKPRHWTTF